MATCSYLKHIINIIKEKVTEEVRLLRLWSFACFLGTMNMCKGWRRREAIFRNSLRSCILRSRMGCGILKILIFTIGNL